MLWVLEKTKCAIDKSVCDYDFTQGDVVLILNTTPLVILLPLRSPIDFLFPQLLLSFLPRSWCILPKPDLHISFNTSNPAFLLQQKGRTRSPVIAIHVARPPSVL